MKLSAINESYEGLPDEDHFDFPEDCSLCGQPVVPGNFSTCHCSEIYCFDCLKRQISTGPPHIARERPNIDPRLVWRFNRIKDEQGNYKRDLEHLWQCRACFELPFHEQMAESYEGLPDEDEFEEEPTFCLRCGREREPEELYGCECGVTYCERCVGKDELIVFGDEGHMVQCPHCVTEQGLLDAGYGATFARQFRRT